MIPWLFVHQFSKRKIYHFTIQICNPTILMSKSKPQTMELKFFLLIFCFLLAAESDDADRFGKVCLVFFSWTTDKVNHNFQLRFNPVKHMIHPMRIILISDRVKFKCMTNVSLCSQARMGNEVATGHCRDRWHSQMDADCLSYMWDFYHLGNRFWKPCRDFTESFDRGWRKPNNRGRDRNG